MLLKIFHNHGGNPCTGVGAEGGLLISVTQPEITNYYRDDFGVLTLHSNSYCELENFHLTSHLDIPSGINNCILKLNVGHDVDMSMNVRIASNYIINNPPDWTEEGATYLICIDHGMIVWNKLETLE